MQLFDLLTTYDYLIKIKINLILKDTIPFFKIKNNKM